jgi:hypothetical protein
MKYIKKHTSHEDEAFPFNITGQLLYTEQSSSRFYIPNIRVKIGIFISKHPFVNHYVNFYNFHLAAESIGYSYPKKKQNSCAFLG